MEYYNFRPVVAINRFSSDTDAEVELLKKHCEAKGVTVAINDAWEKGGDGATELAEKVVSAVSDCPTCFRPLYELDWSFEDKINAIATKMYGAKSVEYTVKAKNQLNKIENLIKISVYLFLNKKIGSSINTIIIFYCRNKLAKFMYIIELWLI